MTWTTKTILDGAGNSIDMRMWDESGVGTGPFSFAYRLSDGAGSGDTGATETTAAAIDTKLGGTLTISGSVTANAGTNLNTSALALEAGNLATIAGAVAGTEMQVDVLTSALPTGAATETTLAAVQTAVELIDNAIAGTEMQVDIVGALPTGANTIGTVNLSAVDNTVLDNIEAGIDELKVLVGEVSATPTENSMLERLQAIETAITNATVSDTTPLEPQAYETVTASSTTQALGATGATGDYLAHIVIQPTSTTMGEVTVFDNLTEVYGHPGGTVDAALAPIHVAITANSVSGAWNITTGAGVKVTAIGTFT